MTRFGKLASGGERNVWAEDGGRRKVGRYGFSRGMTLMAPLFSKTAQRASETARQP